MRASTCVLKASWHKSVSPHLTSLFVRPCCRKTIMATPSRPSSKIASSPADVDAKAGDGFLAFVNKSPTPYHAVHNVKERLEKAGFTELSERKNWSSCKTGGKYYVTRNASSIVAFAIGKKWEPGNPIAAVGAHTDSPCLRVKPISKRQTESFLQVGVETYGGGLWHTWFDRDLSLAGRVMVRTGEGQFHQKLVDLDDPILRIPTLAIHFGRQDNFEFDKETQLLPIAGLAEAQLNQADKSVNAEKDKDSTAEKEKKKSQFTPLKAMAERHHSAILEAVAKKLEVPIETIEDFELILYDHQPAQRGGVHRELLFSSRLDNLNMSYCSTRGLLESLATPSALDDETGIRLVSLFDHEEIGSTSAQGADSNLLPAVIRRLSVLKAGASPTAFAQTCAASFLLSADMAHAAHPSYPAKHESQHHAQLNKGPVVKVNANQRYMTNSPGIVLLQEAARRAEVPLQLFVASNAVPCGSTIGPMLAAKLGMRMLDLGNPQLSMHSIRETGGTYDVDYAIKLFKQFFQDYSELGAKIFVD